MTAYKYVKYSNTAVLVDRAYTAGEADTAASASHATSADTATSATTATALATARNLNVQDADGSHTGTAAAFDGTAAATIKLPATIKATLVGNADTATSATTAATANALAASYVVPVANGGTGNSSVDTAPVSGSTKMVTSGGVYTAIANAVSSAFRYKGSVTNAQLAAIVDKAVGDVYNITDSGTYPAGSNVAWDGTAWDMLSPMYAIDAAPTEDSTNLVQSGGVYTAIADARASVLNQMDVLTSMIQAGTIVAGKAAKLGSTDVGSASVPIYLDDGVATACTSVAASSVPYSGITGNPWSVTDVTI